MRRGVWFMVVLMGALTHARYSDKAPTQKSARRAVPDATEDALDRITKDIPDDLDQGQFVALKTNMEEEMKQMEKAMEEAMKEEEKKAMMEKEKEAMEEKDKKAMEEREERMMMNNGIKGPTPPKLPVPITALSGDEGGDGGVDEGGDEGAMHRAGQVPILNIEHNYRFPEVEVFSYSDGEPVVRDAQQDTFDNRPFALRDDYSSTGSSGCGGSYSSLTGILTSPEYPFNYQNNIRCVYKISLPAGYTVGLDCNDFSVQPGDLDCENDFLEVTDNGAPGEVGNKFCGDKAIAAYSASNNMTLTFQTDATYRYRGFMCRYRALNADGTGAVGTVSTNNTDAEHTVICTGPGDDGWAGKCGVSNGPGRIVGGITTVPHEFPWMVAVLKVCGKDMDHYCHICGGTIIHSQWILTGAHCIVSVPVETIAMLLGDHNLYTLTPSQKFFRVEAVYVHPDFNVPSPLNNDVALAQLPQSIAFSQNTAPICIPPKNPQDLLNLLPRDIANVTRSEDVEMARQANSTAATSAIIHEIFDNRNVSVFGWGTIDDDGTHAQRLRGVSVQILPNDFCDYYYGLMTDTMMCTSGEGGHGPCRGDSGSPAQMQMVDGRWMQVGVLAFGAAYGCEVGYPSGNVLIPLFVDWLEFVTGFDFKEYY